MQFPVSPINFKREKVLPFRAAGMKPRRLIIRCPQKQKCIVIDRHVPKVGGRKTADVREVAEKPLREVDQMNALIDQLAATGNCGICAPLLVVSNASAVPISRSNK